MKKIMAVTLVASFLLAPIQVEAAERSALLNGAASALVPGLGQIMNGDQATWKGRLKIATMFGLEIGGLIATPALARSGFPKVMIGVGMLAVNHVWSATDAYRGASKELPQVYMNAPPPR